MRLQLRHDKPELLTKLRQLAMVLEISLPDPLALGFHWSRAAAMGVPPANSGRVIIEANTRIAAYVTAPSPPELAIPGDTIKGSYTVAKNSAEGLGAASRPGGFPVSYIVPPAESKDAAKEDKKDDDEKDPAAEATLAEAMRGLRITQLGTLAAAIKKLEAKKEEPVVVEKGGIPLAHVAHVVALRFRDISEVTNFSGAFDGCKDFNADLGRWDVSKGKEMKLMCKLGTRKRRETCLLTQIHFTPLQSTRPKRSIRI